MWMTWPQRAADDPLYAEKRLRQLNLAQHKAMVADTDKLVKLANELNAEISGTNPGLLTPEQLRKVAEIEKLAHSVKDKMRMSVQGVPGFQIPLASSSHYPALIVADLRCSTGRPTGWIGRWFQGWLVRTRDWHRADCYNQARISQRKAKFRGVTGMELAVSSARAPETAAASTELEPAADGRNLPADVSLPRGGRPRDPAQAPAEDLLPDFGRRPRGLAGGRGAGPASRLRLVLPLLSRSRALPGAGRHARSR